MAYIIKNFRGKYSTTITTAMYTVPTGKSAIVTSIRFVNVTNSTSPALNLLLNSQYYLYSCNWTIPVSTSTIIEDPITLGSGDFIRIGIASGTIGLDWLVNILERE